MHRRLFLATLGCGSLHAQRGPTVVAKLPKLDIEGAAKAGIRAVELDGDSLPSGLDAIRTMRDRLTGAGVAVKAVSWKLTSDAGLRHNLSVANALDARYVVVLCPAALAPKLQAESVRTGVPVAFRNGQNGFRTPDEIVETLRVNSHLTIAFDPARMLADGHDPAAVIRRALRRLTTVYFSAALKEDARASVLRTLYSLRAKATATVEAPAQEFQAAAALLKPPKKE